MLNSMKNYFALLLLPLMLSAEDLDVKSLLKAEISLAQSETADKQMKFQPVFPVIINVSVKNESASTSDPATIIVRYAYPQPYQSYFDSSIFETEAIEIPILRSGEERSFEFQKKHTLPTITDFVRQNWPMRQYQAVVSEGEKEQIIGTLTLTYSAYYYPIKAN